MIPEIELYPSGEFFNPILPDPRKIHIEDIANSLGMKCRFTGQCRRFISVAEHSVVVSHLVSKRFAKAALLHDATEAYLPDVASPVKQNEVYAGHKLAERHLQRVIEEKFGLYLSSADHATVKVADNVCVGVEADFCLKGFKDSAHWAWVREVHSIYPEVVAESRTLYQFLGPEDSIKLFLDRWKEVNA